MCRIPMSWLGLNLLTLVLFLCLFQPPLPKRLSKDSLADATMASESDDYSSHLQIDATPPVAAKTLRRTRKRNGSVQDLTKVCLVSEYNILWNKSFSQARNFMFFTIIICFTQYDYRIWNRILMCCTLKTKHQDITIVKTSPCPTWRARKCIKLITGSLTNNY